MVLRVIPHVLFLLHRSRWMAVPLVEGEAFIVMSFMFVRATTWVFETV
jgi:hypothetical protein